MRNICFLILLVTILLGCSKEPLKNNIDRDNLATASDTIKLGHSMKGWELYSWTEGTGWKYSFLVGTNRGKNLNEVLSSKIKVTGIDSLKILMKQLPVGESIFWTRKVGQDVAGKLSLPETRIQDEVKAFCETRNLVLYISN